MLHSIVLSSHETVNCFLGKNNCFCSANLCLPLGKLGSKIEQVGAKAPTLEVKRIATSTPLPRPRKRRRPCHGLTYIKLIQIY